MQYEDIKKRLKPIIFMPYFGDEDTSAKIGDVMQVSSFDEHYIRRTIKKIFGLDLDCNISTVTTDEICRQIYEFLQHPEAPQDRPKEPDVAEKALLNSHEVFSIILKAFNDLLDRRVIPNERIANLKTEVEVKTQQNFDKVLAELLWSSFGEHIDVSIDMILNPGMAVYNIANQVTYALVERGKAIDPKIECAHMNPLWVPIRTSITFNTVTDILREKFGVSTLTKTISKIKSYQELNVYVTKLMVKNKINEIVFGSNEFNLCHGISDNLVDTQNAEFIKQSVLNALNVKIDYDISGMKLSSVYKHVYEKINRSQKSRNMLFGKLGEEAEPVANTVNDVADGQVKKPRQEIFRDIIRDINRAVLLGHSVQSYDHVNNLLYKLNGDTKKIDNLNQTFHNLELTYQIKIDTNNPNLTIGDICRAAHDSMVRQGKSESTYVALEDMEPLWAALNPAIVFEHLRSVLRNEIGVSISVYKLSNCRTYDDYAKLVKIALAKKAKMHNR